ncbi:hypothetical protein [Mesorhizobium sp. M2A.F.Ca.ET.039.01.1.1]|uniref:hypothetical protein n=1 Tax=Mesorhizobium sp. M2A.F.Ca.ET.039.01.1.1 TaxID=2496746 RepID=UPI000FCAF115|nr:hypothetical protein [Mesorhizobium sp. M2A.F.Ca.ET.039.01.1.1]RWX72515.1 hypothetical protein EOA24_00550 [Mesorhizobium sp. M2A.F.Ca.ET.039.01.1.1]
MSPEREALADLGRRIDACKAKHGITPEFLAWRRVRRLLADHEYAMRRLAASLRDAERAMRDFRAMADARRWR